jgi:hypothetical protein
LAPFLSVYFLCKSAENRSGGTRTRTGDTMIFSGVFCVYSCSWLFKNVLQMSQILIRVLLVVHRCLWRVGVPVGVLVYVTQPVVRSRQMVTKILFSGLVAHPIEGHLRHGRRAQSQRTRRSGLHPAIPATHSRWAKLGCREVVPLNATWEGIVRSSTRSQKAYLRVKLDSQPYLLCP